MKFVNGSLPQNYESVYMPVDKLGVCSDNVVEKLRWL